MYKVSVPFKINKVLHGLAESHGILRLESGSLFFEFQTRDSILGAIKSDVDKTVLPIADVEEIVFKKGWFKSKLRIRLSNLNMAVQIPGQDDPGEITVSIGKKYVDAAFQLASSVNLEIAEARLRALDSDSDNAAYLE